MKHRKTLTRVALAAPLIIALAFTACVSAPKSAVSTGKHLSDQEKELMELEVIYRLAEDGQLKEAISRIGALSANKPENDKYKFLHASLLLSAESFDEARSIVSGLLLEKPDDVDALFLLAEIERFSGSTRNLTAAFEKILTVDPGNLDAMSGLGDAYFDSKSYKKAEEYYTKTLTVAPANVGSLLGLARIQSRREDYKAARENLDKAVIAAPNDPLVYLDRSRVYYQLGLYAECETDLGKSIEIEPNSAWNYLERGRLFLDTGRHELALADFDKSVKLDPDYFLTYVYRAALFEETGRDAKASADYKKVTELNSDYWYAFESMGVLAFRQGLWREAFSAFDSAAAYTENHGEYYIAAGISLMLNREAKAAKEYASKNLPKISREKEPLQWLMLRLIYDQTDMASELEINIASEKSPDAKAAMLFYLGEYWIAKGRVDLGAKYVFMSTAQDRQGTLEWRMAETEIKRLALKQ